ETIRNRPVSKCLGRKFTERIRVEGRIVCHGKDLSGLWIHDDRDPTLAPSVLDSCCKLLFGNVLDILVNGKGQTLSGGSTLHHHPASADVSPQSIALRDHEAGVPKERAVELPFHPFESFWIEAGKTDDMAPYLCIRIKTFRLFGKTDSVDFQFPYRGSDLRSEPASKPDKPFIAAHLLRQLLFRHSDNRSKPGGRLRDILHIAGLGIQGIHLDRNCQRGICRVEYRSTGRGQLNHFQMLLLGQVGKALLLIYLEIECPGDRDGQEEDEYPPYKADPEPRPFLPVIPHFTCTTCCSVGSDIPSSPLARVSILAGILSDATSSFKRPCSCSCSFNSRRSSPTLRLRSITFTLDHT